MRFLANGDFNFPFDWTLYWVKHFYMWSFQSGTPNPDGLIRLPGRVLNFIVFALFGNIGVSYFYIFSSLAVAFVAFYFFAKIVLEIKQRAVMLLGALFFAINPIFLGNLAKVGLVLAAAMLPLCLVFIKIGFDTRRLRYFLLFFVCLNLSFLHPYTFTVNMVVSGAYFAHLAWKNRQWVGKRLHTFFILGLFALLLNAYFILPLGSMGTVSKDAISDNVIPTAQDYTALVNVSNTGNVFTGLSLSKNIFLDFNFYDGSYQIIYFLGVFAFYALLIALYVSIEKRLSLPEKRRAALFFAAFLVLVALAATTFMNLDVLIKFLIGIPGGWAFRSPLKWQLYIPLVLFGALVVLLGRVTDKVRMTMFQAGFIVIFFMMNSYVAVDVFRKMLVPRQFEHFASLQAADLDNKTLLFVNSSDCMEFLRAHPRTTTELTQVFISRQVQVKRVMADSIGGVNVGSYNYVLGCKPDAALDEMLQSQYGFRQTATYASDNFYLYANPVAQPPVYVTTTVFGLTETKRLADKYQFVTEGLAKPLRFVDLSQNSGIPTSVLQDVFEEVKPKNVTKDYIRSSVHTPGKGKTQLFVQSGSPIFYKVEGSHVELAGIAGRGRQQAIAKNGKPVAIDLPERTGFDITLLDHLITGKNLAHNPSLEDGLWQSKVSDCYAYDNQPDIGMRLNSGQRTDGEQSLQLEARRHIACSGPDRIPVKPGEHYLITFDYQSLGKRYGGYQITFDDPEHTFVQERLPGSGDSWQTFSREIVVPAGAQRLKLMLYAYPDGGDGLKTTMTRYDNVHIYKTPTLQNRFYLVQETAAASKAPDITYIINNPTKKTVHVKGASQPFYLATNETYSPLWQLSALSAVDNPFARPAPLGSAKHMRLHSTMNAWYIDPASACRQAKSGCTKNADGSYNMALAITFAPQRWFYIGGIVSLLAAVAGVVYFAYDHKRDHHSRARRKGTYKWRS